MLCRKGILWSKYFNNATKRCIPKLNCLVTQTLYTDSSLGMTDFQVKKRKVASLFPLYSRESFIIKMSQAIENTEGCVIEEVDLSNMIYLCENNTRELEILNKMVIRYHTSRPNFKDFRYGHEVMRVYFQYKLPQEAKQILNEEKLGGFFNTITSYIVAMTLFFNEGLYQDVRDSMWKLINEKVSQRSCPTPIARLGLAACYRMNTEDSLEESTEILRRLRKDFYKIYPDVICFPSALALQQKKPYIAMEMMSSTRVPNSIFLSIKIMALLQLGRPEQTLPSLSELAEVKSNFKYGVRGPKIFPINLLNGIRTSLEDQGNKETLEKFYRIEKFVREKVSLQDVSLDELLCKPRELF